MIDLERLCDRDKGNVKLATPFHWNGYDCATNGNALLMVRGTRCMTRELQPNLHGYFEARKLVAATHRHVVQYHDLVDALRAYGDYWGACNGEQQWSIAGLALPGGVYINARLAFEYLRELAGDVVRMYWGGAPLEPVRFSDQRDRWLVHVMPLRWLTPGELAGAFPRGILEWTP